MTWLSVFLSALAIAVGAWALRHHPRFPWLVGGLGAALLTAWVAVAMLVSTDYRDADGFFDCWPDCTPWQDAVLGVILGVPVMLAGLTLGALVARIARRRKR